MPNLKSLLEHESGVDVQIAALPLLTLPVRVPLTIVMRVLFGLMHGTPATGVQPRSDAATSLAGRLSHLISLLTKCPPAPADLNPAELETLFLELDPSGDQVKLLLAYAHFADLMPEIHRGYFSVVQVSHRRYSLSHKDGISATQEAEDILISELALAYSLRNHEIPHSTFDDYAKQKAGVLPGDSIATIKTLGKFFLENIFEPQFVSDEGLHAAMSVTHAEFNRFRAPLLAMATFAAEMAKAYQRRLAMRNDDEEAFEGWLHWLAPSFGLQFFRGYLITESGLTDTQVERLLSSFSVDLRNSEPAIDHARDGFFPPIWQLPDKLILCVDPTMLFTQTRNAIFSVQSTNKELFDNHVSKYLEPELIREAIEILAAIPDIQIIPDVDWKVGAQSGQIDLLLYDRASNAVFQIQAKAPLPPQGARLVQRLEGRIVEGLEQLRSFRNLPTEERDKILSHALGVPVSNYEMTDVLLARSCFGTSNIHKAVASSKLFSLGLLAGAVADCIESLTPSLPHLLTCYEELRSVLLKETQPRWERDVLSVGDLTLEIPLLRFDERAIDRLRRTFWRKHKLLAKP